MVKIIFLELGVHEGQTLVFTGGGVVGVLPEKRSQFASRHHMQISEDTADRLTPNLFSPLLHRIWRKWLHVGRYRKILLYIMCWRSMGLPTKHFLVSIEILSITIK